MDRLYKGTTNEKETENNHKETKYDQRKTVNSYKKI